MSMMKAMAGRICADVGEVLIGPDADVRAALSPAALSSERVQVRRFVGDQIVGIEEPAGLGQPTIREANVDDSCARAAVRAAGGSVAAAAMTIVSTQSEGLGRIHIDRPHEPRCLISNTSFPLSFYTSSSAT